uniref:Uncharacterized protein n=1 Tax=Physcomitrium patens TaxID=3218 RepID=A0A7I4FLJ2_PHYPA
MAQFTTAIQSGVEVPIAAAISIDYHSFGSARGSIGFGASGMSFGEFTWYSEEWIDASGLRKASGDFVFIYFYRC